MAGVSTLHIDGTKDASVGFSFPELKRSTGLASERE